jgi:hypothetical protein
MKAQSGRRRSSVTEPAATLSLKEVAQRLDDARIVWAVFAGAAANAYGATRPLTDIDILVPLADRDRIVALFPEAQIMYREDGAVRGLQLPGFDILAGLSLMDLDPEMAARLTRHEIAGTAVTVIPPEDNILIKAVFGRGPEQGKHDWEDVQAMLAHLPALDWGYVYWRAQTCAPQERVQQALARLETLARQMGKAAR